MENTVKAAREAAIQYAKRRGSVSYAELLRYEGMPYGMAGRVLRGLAADGVLIQRGDVHTLAGGGL
jgi:hypothetical protein